MAIDFGALLDDCRALLTRNRTWFRQWLGLGVSFEQLLTDGTGDDPQLRPHYLQLLRDGMVVWAAIAQANREIYSPGDGDRWGNVVFSADPHFNNIPGHLREVGMRIYDIKGTTPEEPELVHIADLITDEYNCAEREHVPHRLTEGRDVLFGSCIFHREWLPRGYLADRILPVIIIWETPTVMMLPRHFWPEELRQHWGNLTEPALEQFRRMQPPSSFRPVRTGPRHRDEWDDEETPVRFTPRALAALRRMAQEHRVEPIQVAVAFRPGGGYTMDLATDWDQAAEERFQVQGVFVLIPRGEVDGLWGSEIDFLDSATAGRGFIVRTPDQQ